MPQNPIQIVASPKRNLVIVSLIPRPVRLIFHGVLLAFRGLLLFQACSLAVGVRRAGADDGHVSRTCLKTAAVLAYFAPPLLLSRLGG